MRPEQQKVLFTKLLNILTIILVVPITTVSKFSRNSRLRQGHE